MSESGYQEIDLDNPGKAAADAEASDIEIVEEAEAAPAPEPAPVPAEAVRAASTVEDNDDSGDDDSATDASSERKKQTRSQRLKNQRDAYARQLAETQARLADAENRARRYEADANEGAAIGFDLYAKQLDTALQALRRDFDQAFDAGDREKIFDVQQRMAQLTAERAQIERDRRTIPTKPVQQSGPAAQPQTPPTPPQQPRRQPTPAAMEWYERNKVWFNKDVVMTAGARVIDNQMVRDGYTPEDPDYFEELDKRLQKEFPHKFGRQAPAPARQPANNPTIQNRSTPAAAPGKVRVTITQADRDMANHLGISVEQYAREKAKTERAAQTVSQYTEIL